MKYDSHGKKTPEYIAWFNMRARATYAGYHGAKNYSERGIRVCKEWMESFESFLNHVGPRPSPLHSIDRIENDKDYEPGNVRWATREEQQANTRRTRFVTYKGETAHCSEWDRRMGFPAGTVSGRLTGGFDIDRAMTEQYVARVIRNDSVYEVNGKMMSVDEIAKLVGVTKSCITYRLSIGLTGDALLSRSRKWKSTSKKQSGE